MTISINVLTIYVNTENGLFRALNNNNSKQLHRLSTINI